MWTTWMRRVYLAIMVLAAAAAVVAAAAAGAQEEVVKPDPARAYS